MLFRNLQSDVTSKHIFLAFLIFPLVLLAGCGGGGGSSSDSGGSSVSAMAIMSDSSFHFTCARNAPMPATEYATLLLYGVERLELRSNTALPSWLRATFDYVGAMPALAVSVRTTDLAPGTYRASFQVVAIDEYITRETIRGYQDISVTYQVTSMSTGQSDLRFRIVDGSTQLPAAQQVTLHGDAIAWQAGSDVNWLDISPASGTSVSGDITISLNAEALNMAVGVHTGTVSVSAGGSVSNIDVALQVDPRSISAIRNGIALTALPSGGRLSQTTQIIDAAGSGGVEWAASADVPWLQVTPANGVTGDTLTVTADPTGLGNGLHYATVTLAPRNVVNPVPDETIRVAFYVSDQDPDPITTVDRRTMPPPITGLSAVATVVDPLRPYLYTYEWNGTEHIIGRYNMYTGAYLPVFNPQIPSGRSLEALVVSSDGSRLFIIHSHITGTSDFWIVTMNLDTGAIESSVAISENPTATQCEYSCTTEDFTRAIYVRQNGTEVLVTNMLDVIDPQTGENIFKFEPTSGSVAFFDFQRLVIRSSPDGRMLYLQGRDYDSIYNDNKLFSFRLTLSGIPGEVPIVEDLGSVMVLEDGFQNQLAVNRDGDTVCSLGDVITCYDPALSQTISIVPHGYEDDSVKNAMFNFDNDLYLGWDVYPDHNADDITVYDTGLNRIDGLNLSSYLEKLDISGDGRRLVAIHGGRLSLSFIDVY